MKNFVEALGKVNSDGFVFLCNKFPKKDKARMQDVFGGSEICKVLQIQILRKRWLHSHLSGCVQIVWTLYNIVFISRGS